MIYYIINQDGDVVAKYDGIDVTVKDSHEKNEVDDITELPELDKWDSFYE